MNSVLVFKTSISNKSDIQMLGFQINKVTQNSEWNFDLEDPDKILRVVGNENITYDIIRILNRNGFECIELEE